MKRTQQSLIRADESERLRAIRRYDILDTPPDGAFDRITALAARLFQVPISIISIVDEDRIWFKSHHGIDASEVGRDPGLCASAIMQDGPYILENAAVDPSAMANPLVAGELGLRFYAAAPLTTADGFKLGTLCVIDKQPRALSESDAATLRDLAGLVMDELELRLKSIQAVAEIAKAQSAADKASQAKTDFLSHMSHELRSPLNAILGYAQIMEDAPEQTAMQKESNGEILQAGWYLLGLINEILDLGMIESGKLLLSPEPTSLNEVLRECQSMMEPLAQKRGIVLSFGHFEAPCIVRADRTRLKQILVNLVSNAIKYNRAEGTVVVECIYTAPGRFRISIKDNGQGMAPEQLAHLFEPFNRLGQESGAEEGTGIGLVLTKRLVELMGGRIGVESTVGEGSEFWVEFVLTTQPTPATGADADAARRPEPVREHTATPRTVLCIEDDRANLKLVEHIVERIQNIRLLSAGDATLGLALARRHRPDVILMDINLPGISGVRALTLLLEDPLTRHVPVVAISANAMPHDVRLGLEAGFFRYLTKPLKVNEFLDVLDAALAASETARAASGSNNRIAADQ